MSRLIDADEAYEVITEAYHHTTDIQHKALRETLDRIPTVDAVEVVRCKDCVYFEYDCRLNGGRCGIHNNNFGLPEAVWKDYFCNYGHRRKADEGKNQESPFS